jgi:hypothetical protein
MGRDIAEVQGSEFRVQSSGFRVQGSELKVQKFGSGFEVSSVHVVETGHEPEP